MTNEAFEAQSQKAEVLRQFIPSESSPVDPNSMLCYLIGQMIGHFKWNDTMTVEQAAGLLATASQYGRTCHSLRQLVQTTVGN